MDCAVLWLYHDDFRTRDGGVYSAILVTMVGEIDATGLSSALVAFKCGLGEGKSSHKPRITVNLRGTMSELSSLQCHPRKNSIKNINRKRKYKSDRGENSR